MDTRARWMILLCLAVATLGCDERGKKPPAAPTVAPATAPAATTRTAGLRYLALGDSYTIGQNVEVADRYPVQIVNALRERGMEVGEPSIIARTGWTTRDLEHAMIGARLVGPFDLVTILIGVNNQYQGRPVEEFRLEVASLLEESITLAGGEASRVVALSIPDWGATPFGARGDVAKVGKEIDAFNKALSRECARLGVVLVDVTPISRTAPTNADLIAGDGLHPSGKMYKLWAEAAMPSVVKAVSGKGK